MSIRENIHNYYEKMVTELLAEKYADQAVDQDHLADAACVALNHLPPRYFRHEIDMAFYLSPAEHREMSEKVAAAVKDAMAYVSSRRRDRED